MPAVAVSDTLPEILAGPMVRHANHHQLVLWLVTSRRRRIRAEVFDIEGKTLFSASLGERQQIEIPVGERCFMQLLVIPLDLEKQTGLVAYDLFLDDEPESLAERLDGWCYGEQTRSQFPVNSNLSNILHGSCRKPHHPSDDGLLAVDSVLEAAQSSPDILPSLLMLSGDQVYVDDVAGPMLVAIHQLSERLGLFTETFEGATVGNNAELLGSSQCYFERNQLLPQTRANRDLVDLFFGGAEKPIFTSAGAHNHLISFAEVTALYLLCWSPEPWTLIDLSNSETRVKEEYRERYREELGCIEQFAEGLVRVRRALGHIPVYMIFDDHDITDDWNLTRGWEEAAYGHPFSKRIIGNALLGYWLYQGLGNSPQSLLEVASLDAHFTDQGLKNHEQLIDALLEWDAWHYELETSPALVVLDTRTHRWRSEASSGKPSGLMDWEALSDLQQTLMSKEAVIMVSPSPVFGVKLIETVQRIFTFFGHALTVDAENWMAHPGAAMVMLNIFQHQKTPPQFMILSGDVHYSFAYDITLRNRRNSPRILQVTASGLKNQFPEKLLKTFDIVNQSLYSSRSPLNVFTKRRHMRIKERHPDNGWPELYNRSGVGQVLIEGELASARVKVIHEDGEVEFL